MGSEIRASAVPKSRWFRMIPLVILIYIAAAIDKTNIGYALAGGMKHSLGLTATFSGLASGIFFIGYLFLQVPGGMMAHRGNAKKYIAWTVAAFGTVSIISAFSQNAWELLVTRFLLGFTEGGLFPAILIMITKWFPNEERGRANALFLMNGVFANLIGGPLSGWLLTVWNWRGLFVVEGLFSFVLIAIWLPLISNTPQEAKWLSESERTYIETRIAAEQRKFGTTKKVPLKQVFTNPNSWKLILIYFCMQVGIYGLSLWMPTELKQMTHAGIATVGILSMFPNFASLIGQYIIGRFSDRSSNRKFHTFYPMFLFAVCLVLSTLFGHVMWLSFAFLILCGAFWHAPSAVFWTIPPLLSNPEYAAAERGVVNALGNLGGFLGPFLVGWLTSAFNFSVGYYCLVVFVLIGAFITLSLPNIVGKASQMPNSETTLAQ